MDFYRSGNESVKKVPFRLFSINYSIFLNVTNKKRRKFTTVYQFYWSEFFPDQKLLYPATFDGRVVLYPNEEVLRDYLSWRQADCHINNLYNTTFHALIKHKKMTPAEAEKHLCKSVSSDKVKRKPYD